ncbi:SDR family NAD(P)-dependent oxidoreductase [Nocardia pseudobrasiliensis]|uniref:Short-subunit dehydrogenase n=1 Tax=Nocardia pseudobrasiliensis TaxID=45979 RepID=A0A370IC91_9NOCA|nr:oxidoreductase [Nocardia pseudobrasiliensis]RDI68339.1 short-subunit dehydrogenase [Nocardia pseudobrasiliensis]
MDLNLKDKVALITGGSKGIGLAIAKDLAAEGARVVVGSRTVSDALAQLRDNQGVTVVPVDLATAEGPGELVSSAIETYGGIDVLINNVGASEPGPTFAQIDDDAWQRIFDITFFSAVRASRAAIPSLISRGGGAIVNISSINAKLPDPAIAHYSAAKAALSNLNKSLAIELAPHKIRVNAISPGPVRTPFWTDPGGFAHIVAGAAGTTPEKVVDEVVPQNMGTLTGRFSEATEVSALAVFLASDRAANITGADYVLDGGTIKTV